MEKGGVLKTSFILSGLGMIRFMSPDTESNIWAGLFHKVWKYYGG